MAKYVDGKLYIEKKNVLLCVARYRLTHMNLNLYIDSYTEVVEITWIVLTGSLRKIRVVENRDNPEVPYSI